MICIFLIKIDKVSSPEIKAAAKRLKKSHPSLYEKYAK